MRYLYKKKLQTLTEKICIFIVFSKVLDIAKQGPSRISVPELLEELQVTKNELENIKVSEIPAKFFKLINNRVML